MKKYLVILCLLTTGGASGQIPADSIRAIIGREVAAKRSKSIIVGIVDARGRHLFSAGRLSNNNPALPDAHTMYEIGSITKVFTSLLLADMSLKGRLNVADPVSRFLPPTVKTPTRNGKEISLLHLSTHRAGFPRNPYNLDPADPDNPFADYTAILVRKVSPGNLAILTWAGLRGGIAVAMALSLPESDYRETILAIAYFIVIFSVIIQGLTLNRVVDRAVGGKAPAVPETS